MEMLNTLTLTERNGKTTLTLRAVVLKATPEAAGPLAGWQEGWTQSLGKLTETLQKFSQTEKFTMGKTTFTVEPGKQDVTVTRIFDAPRELVFKACTDPNLISKWWGPRNLTTTIERLEGKTGGSWRFIQRDAEGHEFGFHGVYHEIKRPERTVETFEFEGMPGHVSMNIATLEDVGGKTRLTVHSIFQSVEDRDGMVNSGMQRGMEEGYDRLEELVIKTVPSSKSREKA